MAMDCTPLVRMLKSGDRAQQQAAAEKLAQAAEDAQPAAVALVEACALDDETREWVVSALEGLGPPSTADVPRLAALLHDSSPDAAYWAATLLGRLEYEAAPAVAELARGLAGNGAASVRQRCAWALGQIGPPAAAAQAALEQAAGGSDPRLASLARAALAAIQG